MLYCYIVILLYSYIVILFYCYIFLLLYCYIVILFCYIVVLLCCYIVTLLCCKWKYIKLLQISTISEKSNEKHNSFKFSYDEIYTLILLKWNKYYNLLGNDWDAIRALLPHATHVLCHSEATILGVNFCWIILFNILIFYLCRCKPKHKKCIK